jgi:tungstate transport system substrate-binding protein
MALSGIALTGCGETANPSDRLRLATTTSTENSGLLDDLLPAFREATDIEVQVLSMGTGKALATGERGDCDVLLVHAPAAEEAFVAKGSGKQRHPVMYNDFVIVGPESDPAGARGGDVLAAMRAIATTGATFLSRGDDSGTHEKELALWREAGVDPKAAAAGYNEGGDGMGATLTQAGEREAYTLADRGTYLAYAGKLALVVLVEGDARLKNPYSVIAVDEQRHPHVNHEGAAKFIDWLVGPEGQRRIGAFRVGGKVLFHPDAWR